ncbi:hypothetical protein Q3G72_031187 [Acer saccharum]|nr:hypothetical protein Q3G72_031187 [Acer saccharum]
MELHGFSSLSSKMAMPSSSSSHHERFLSSSSFFCTRVGAGQSNTSISGVQLGKSNNSRRKCATFKRHVTTSILADVAKDFMVLAATQTPGESGKKWFHGTADAIRQFIRLFEVNGVDLAEVEGGEVAITNLHSYSGPEFVLHIQFFLNKAVLQPPEDVVFEIVNSRGDIDITALTRISAIIAFYTGDVVFDIDYSILYSNH